MAADIDKLVKIEVSSDKLEARFFLDAGINPQELTPIFVQARLSELGLKATREQQLSILDAINAYAAAPDTPARFVVLQGTPPIHGVDGCIQTTPAARPRADHPAPEDETLASIDPRTRSSIAYVRAGTMIAHVTPAQAGVDGIDVFGQTIPARTPRGADLAQDDSILVRADGAVLALRDGIVEHAGRVLRVSNRLIVDGSIDFHTGNIRFPGDVEIIKGIRDCFEVSSGGSIFVRDLVDAATMTCAHHMVLEKGIAARELGSLDVGKDLTARYLTNVRAVVGRTCSVEADVTNCTLLVGRDFRSPDAAIIRGEVCVARVCDVGSLGAQSGAATIVRLGRLANSDTLLAQLADLGAKAKDRCDKANTKLAELRRVQGRRNAQYAEELTQLQFDAQVASRLFAKACKAAQTLHHFLGEHTMVQLTVRQTIHPGTKLFAGQWQVEFPQPLLGPRVIELDARGELLTRPTGSREPQDAMPLRSCARVVRVAEHIDAQQVLATLGIAA